MDHETEIAIAELKGELKTSRAENEAMESRIDARLAGVDARLDTRLAGVDASLALMREDAARRDADAARRDADAAKRDKDNQRWIVGFGIAQVVLTVAVLAAGFAFLGILIGLPTS